LPSFTGELPGNIRQTFDNIRQISGKHSGSTRETAGSQPGNIHSWFRQHCLMVQPTFRLHPEKIREIVFTAQDKLNHIET
jgi:hypothetical protein